MYQVFIECEENNILLILNYPADLKKNEEWGNEYTN